jgi:nicotinate-nucleotide pyrophosphorylase
VTNDASNVITGDPTVTTTVSPDKSTETTVIDSGGGAVSGVADAGNLIKLIDQSVKPIYSFTDGAMCSAAYWLGCSAREVYSSNVSTVGSIGVIATHMEQKYKPIGNKRK